MSLLVEQNKCESGGNIFLCVCVATFFPLPLCEVTPFLTYSLVQ